MSKITEKLKGYEKSREGYLAKVEEIKKQIEGLRQQCTVIKEI